ncbi:odorant receptor 85b-like [Uranotaenia lowii]|uniref:odorant receptor 85b-like n=1 Tax=Uranotaenia lowii TaxID=190385 RepID=UPI00247AC2CB|nr:odorant receptor 85b-like [Uranotaenia lowii]
MDLVVTTLRGRVRLFDTDALDRQRSAEACEYLFNFLRIFLKLIGCDIIDEQWSWNWRTSVTAGSISTFYVFQIYSVYFFWGQWFLVLESLSISGIAIQAVVKMHRAINGRLFYVKTHKNLLIVHRTFCIDRKHNRSLMFCVVLIEYVFKAVGLAYAAAGVGFFMLPMLQYFWFNEKALALQIVLPGIDPASEWGYWVTTFYHVTVVTVAFCGLLTSDMALMAIVLHIVGLADVFQNTLVELDDMLERPNPNVRDIIKKQATICVMHKEIIRYEEDLDEFYGLIIFIQVLASVANLTIALFLSYMTGKIASFLFLVAMFGQLLEFCSAGTVLTLKNEEILLSLYNTLWYKLPTSNQRTLCIMLQRSQNAVEMTIGGLSLLNLETFILKRIYSYSAIIRNFVE